MNNIQETIFQAIETITESKINKLKFDKTIEAIIVSDSKADVGEYEVKYQDLMFTAYSSNNTGKFSKDENVLILIPDGDMNKRKTIIASNKREGEVYVDFDKVIDRFGINFVDEADGFEIGLSTTFDETVSFNLKKQSMIDLYPDHKFLSVGAELYTNINQADLEGSYGIAIDCIFLNNAGERIPHTFKFTNLNVTGNPYQARGYKETIIPLLEERLVEIVSARAFSEGFTAGNERIKFKNIIIEYVSIRDSDKSDYSGNIVYPKGLHFRSNLLYPDEKLPLIMEFKQQGQILETKAINYKWFVMNGEINSSDNDKYHPDAGLGWEWLLPGSYDENLIKGMGTSTLEVSASFVPNFSTFKCIATYEDKGVMVTDMETMVDHTENIDIEIISTNGPSFINGVGDTTLICTVLQSEKPIEEEIEYEWTQVKDDGTPVLIYKGPNNSLPVLASSIGTKSTYTCEINLKEYSRPIGTGHTTLVNIVDGSAQGAVIVGGFRTALYDADGKAPTDIATDGFQFDVYDNGEKVTTGLDWTWKIPSADKTLLTLENPIIDAVGNQTTKNRVLYLGLEKDFDINKRDNVIEVDVKYTKGGVTFTLIEYATISITRVGSNGADGAAGKPGADGHTYVYEIQGGTGTVSYDGEGANPMPAIPNDFVLMFSKDGDVGLANEVETVLWELPPYPECALSFAGMSTAIRSMSTYQDLNGSPDNPHVVSLIPDSTWTGAKFNNYLSAKITYEGMIFRESYPISFTKNGDRGESGYTITTFPNNHTYHFDEDGFVIGAKELLVNFEIKESGFSKVFDIVSYNQVPGLNIIKNNDNVSVTIKVLSDFLIPNEAQIEFILSCNGQTFKQVFSIATVSDGVSPYTVSLYSTNGLTFKRGDINTVVYAIVRKGTLAVNELIPQEAYVWTKIDRRGEEDLNWEPIFLDGQRDKIIVTPNDILERATFDCSIEM